MRGARALTTLACLARAIFARQDFDALRLLFVRFFISHLIQREF